MKQYHSLVDHILAFGEDRPDRTGTGTRGVFGYQMHFNLQSGFPLLTTKKTNFHAIAVELLWFLKGSSNISWLHENNVHIWDEWADDQGNLGPVYGMQWRHWPQAEHEGYGDGIDQIAQVIDAIKNNPYSRRHIVTAWNPDEIELMALPPCHTMFQFNVRGDQWGTPTWLDCQLYQRSGDVFLGVPFNIASYALLTHMVAQVTGLHPGHFIHTLGDAHLYKNHLDQAQLLLERDPRKYSLPTLTLNQDVKNIDDFTLEDIHLVGYESFPAIKAEISV